MRRRYVYDSNGNQIEVVKKPSGPMIMPDIKPYRSMITGEMITSRSKHREHLKDHGCIEVGDQVDHMLKNRIRPDAPPGLREDLLRAAYKHRVLKP